MFSFIFLLHSCSSSSRRHREIIVYWFMVPEGNLREENLTVSRKQFSFITEKPLQQRWISTVEKRGAFGLWRSKISVEQCFFPDELIEAIHHDIHSADQLLESNACREYSNHSFFHQWLLFLSCLLLQLNKYLFLRRRQAEWSIIGEIHRLVVTRSCRRFAMVDIEDRMTTECEVFHALVRFRSLQWTEDHKANTEDREDGENEDNHEWIRK